MKLLKVVLSIELVIALTWLLDKRMGIIPPLGKLLSPEIGLWNNAEPKETGKRQVVEVKDLSKATTVEFDRNFVPHIFAASDYDLYFAQGYITARDRLWQMDMQVRMAAGRSSEVLGRQTLGQDRYFRRIGLTYAAENSLALMSRDSVMSNMLKAYSDGVNAYIQQLTPARYPIEFKLLDYAPERWQPINSILIFKLMAESLSAGADDFQMSNDLRRFGKTVVGDLFPDQPFLSDPVIPADTKWGFTAPKMPEPPAAPTIGDGLADAHPVREGIGSNNWAVSGARSITGYPLLANDPHLSLTLPSIWYQLQMTSPGVSVYGVSIPGIPCVIIGFNRQAAWGLTNAEADVADWYRVRFKDAGKSEYWYRDHWNKVSLRYEKIRIRGEKTITDTIRYTVHGPVAREGLPRDKEENDGIPIAYAFKWAALTPSEDIKTFYQLDRARDSADFRKALVYFSCPAQNFLFASNSNEIGMVSAGKYPIRYHDQGKFILDGSDSAEDWHGWIPPEQIPATFNPARGFLSSANQAITDSTYPYYISWQFGSAERAIRINDRLSEMHRANEDTMRVLQDDTYSTMAEKALPLLLSTLHLPENANCRAAFHELSRWDYRFDAGSAGATIFNLWWNILYRNIWQDKFASKSVVLRWPSQDRTLKLLLTDRNSPLFDNDQTPEKETFSTQVNLAFVEAVDSLGRLHGDIGPKWEWGLARPCRIMHLAGIDAFSIGPFAAGGAASTVDALTDGFGPSWRMIVRLGPQMKGYGVFPGGQSGNPGSYFYDNLFPAWKAGKLNELVFLGSEKDTTASILSTLILK